MRFRRKDPARPDPAGAAARAAGASREHAETELERQKSAAHAEHAEVVAPLRRMREKNHLAEMFIATIREGYGR
jgi:hypothetical protein